jgi:AcrR family transcriptional regulator
MLDAAEAEFADKGYDGARIDEVARRAGVNKSHIYYHFDGKEQLLDALVDARLADLLAEKDALLAGVTEIDERFIERFVHDSVARLLAPRQAFLRIVLMESLKGAGRRTPMFRLVDVVVGDALHRLAGMGVSPDPAEFATAALYFALLPIVTELLIGPAWAAHRGTDAAEERGRFTALLTEAYTSYLDRISGPASPSITEEER